ncbi:MAG: GntR family transcriptional regulator [Opitutaceae bacterium]|nr:GntR family transcriptional regulator [Opitutaceae bacterium]
MKRVTSEVAYEYIRKRIQTGEYPPGFSLVTEVLSSEIGVSRTPVREALHRLATDGLVEIRPRHGATVKQMDLAQYRDFCGLRLALEGYAAMLAALVHTPLELRTIKLALDAMRTHTERIIVDDQDKVAHEALMAEDVRFHVSIMSAAKNNLVKSEILRLHLVNRILFGPADPSGPPIKEFANKAEHDENRRRVLANHEEIYDAIARRDAPAAREAMERHIQDIIDHAALTFGGTPAVRELTPEELAYRG